MFESPDAVLALVLRDFAGTPVATAEVRLIDFDPARPADFSTVLIEPESWVIPSAPTERRLLLAVVDNVTAVEPVDDVPQIVVEIASALQDFVMDKTNQPWPEVTSDGRSTILEPALAPDGSPCWAAPDSVVCAIGELSDRL